MSIKKGQVIDYIAIVKAMDYSSQEESFILGGVWLYKFKAMDYTIVWSTKNRGFCKISGESLKIGMVVRVTAFLGKDFEEGEKVLYINSPEFTIIEN